MEKIGVIQLATFIAVIIKPILPGVWYVALSLFTCVRL